MAEKISLLPLSESERAALLAAVTMVLGSIKMQPLGSLESSISAVIKMPLEGIEKKLKNMEV